MFSKLLTATLGALSFITDGGVPSCQNLGQWQQQPALSRLQAAQMGPSVAPKPGTYLIQSKSFGSSPIRTYSVGQPLYVSLTREWPGQFGTFELALIDGSETEFGMKNVGQSASVVIDGDNKFVTTTTDSGPQGFTLESTESEGYFIVRTTDGTDRVWTLNPEEGPVIQRIMLAPQDDDTLIDSQHFQFKSFYNWGAVGGHSAQSALTLDQSYASDESPIPPGKYMIFDSFVQTPIRSYEVGKDIFSDGAAEFPGPYGYWIVAGDDKDGYTITNEELDLPVIVTSSNALSTQVDATPAKFTFVERDDNGLVSVELTSGAGVWHMNVFQGPVRAVLQIQPQDSSSLLQRFNFLPVAQ